jgi:hypothetical protein
VRNGGDKYKCGESILFTQRQLYIPLQHLKSE